MATEADPVIVRIIASQKDLEKSLAASIRATERAAAKMEKSLAGVGSGAGKNLSNFGQNAAKGTQQASQAATQLSFQLNDIATSLSGGASPFQVMMQQGSQVTQVMQGIRAQGGSMGQVVAGAFTSMVNPIALVSFGLIAAAGYALKYFTATEDGSKESEKALKKEQDLIDGVIQKWGALLPTLKEISDARKALADQSDLRSVTQAEAVKVYKDVKAEIEALVPAIGNVKTELRELNTEEADAAIKALNAAMANLLKENDQGTANFADIQAVIDTFATVLKDSANPEVQNLIKSFNDVKPAIDVASGSVKAMREEAEKAAEKQKVFNKALEDMRDIAKGHLSDAEKLIELYNTAIGAMGTLDDKQRELMERRMLPGFLEAQQTTVLGGGAAGMIKKEEGFRPEAYWDVNAFRVGFGSDTYVDKMGQVQKVTKDTVVTVEQAEADLARRIPQFQKTITDAIGPEMWKSLTEDQQAALTSIAYNYGSLPASIVKAIKSGGGQEAVAQAIGSLTANPERRKREAAAFGGYTAPKETPDMKFADDLKQSAASTRELNAELQVLAQSGGIIQDFGYKTEYAKKQQELLNKAEAEGVTITPELTAKINAAADAHARTTAAIKLQEEAAKSSADRLKDQAQAAQQFAQQVSGMAQSAIGGLVNDLRNGVSAGEAFNNMLNRIIDSLIQMSIQSLFDPKSGLGGFFSSLIGGGVSVPAAATGGIVGASISGRRNVSPAVFAGAPRFATGGMVGLRAGEVPIIAHRGEMIIPRNMVGKVGAGAGQTSINNQFGNIRIDMAGTGVVAGNGEDAKKFGLQIQKAVQMIMVQESRPGGLLRRA